LPHCPAGQARPRLEVADIFRAHAEAYRQAHALTPQQARAMRAIESCRTAALGGHLEVCDDCGFERPAYNSCRNRHCPKCQARAQGAWVDKHVARLLPTHYFHVVFTLPEELRALVHRNRRALFDLLFEAASQTLLQLGRSRLDATLTITAVLHTWTRELHFHPHVHCIVSGGGLSGDEASWVATAEDYLFPHLVLSRLFRGKFLAGLVRLYDAGALDLGGACQTLADPQVFRLLKQKLYAKDWVVYAKPPFAGPEQVYRYLGRYTHRIAISNSRIQAFDQNGVRFGTKQGRSLTLAPHEFIRRFLLHVLPEGFHKIRHYGLLAAGNLGTKLVRARQLLLASVDVAVTPPKPTSGALEWMLDWTRCPQCRRGTMVSRPLPMPRPRSPPMARAS
jgi:hypothetical protein